MWRFGESLGAERVGTTLYELPPGEAVCPYHYEHSAEEWLLVLEGTPTLREPDGEHRLEPMDVRSLRPAPAGRTKSATTAPRRLVCSMRSDNSYPDAATYPDSNKIGIWTQPGEHAKLYRLGTEVDVLRRRDAAVAHPQVVLPVAGRARQLPLALEGVLPQPAE